VKRHIITLAAVFLALTAMPPLRCATLERLTLDEMISKSSAIVRGKVTDSWAALTGSVIYTHYRIQASETYKGGSLNFREIVVTGGTVNGIHQNFSGSPTLNKGSEFVFFLWTSKAGLTQIIGLSQGAFNLTPMSSGDSMVTRFASTEHVVDQAGNDATDSNFQMRLGDLRSQVAHTLRSAHQ